VNSGEEFFTTEFTESTEKTLSFLEKKEKRKVRVGVFTTKNTESTKEGTKFFLFRGRYRRLAVKKRIIWEWIVGGICVYVKKAYF